jgi:arginine utilization protein RocB
MINRMENSKMNELLLHGIDKDIEDILYPYVKVRSDTHSALEKDVEPFLMDFFNSIEYFRQHPENFGTYKIYNDVFGRSVCWGLLKGQGDDTVVLIHHYDVVDIEDFKTLKPFAYSPAELEKELLRLKEELLPEAREDLESGAYIFGRGTADMKGGGAIQLALLKRYSSLPELKGNILLISVPDEENLSAGMMGAVLLLEELKEKHRLNYLMMVNSEPHQRVDKSVGVLSEGSVGKMMPFIYVRGFLSHVGKVFEGFNPVSLLSEIVCRTNLNLELSDFIENEASPPPTWLYFKDSKLNYDVSLPQSAGGCLSILTLNREPAAMLESIRSICTDAFEDIILSMNNKYRLYMEKMNKPFRPLPWKAKVVTFKELYDEAYEAYGEAFRHKYEKALEEISARIQKGEATMIESSFSLVEAVYDFINDISPRVVIGLAPPYYPNVSNLYIENISEAARNLSHSIMEYSLEHFGQAYSREFFFTGISDLSYTSIRNSKVITEALTGSMPLFGSLYSIPAEVIEDISMPCINVGPWGKDFHKLTERVLKEDLFHRTPRLLNYAISRLLSWDEQL